MERMHWPSGGAVGKLILGISRQSRPGEGGRGFSP